ncbi:hypothetical protein A8U91_00384 [Halomonas elongata]|uniref:Uncharacterized protein n=1 Tax=Halomonas elongata TaxID=2746 RepID=A0A1B8P1E9_HALEL|nr:hypothetical protein A8U91_00384 [Halomonas elongata]
MLSDKWGWLFTFQAPVDKKFLNTDDARRDR